MAFAQPHGSKYFFLSQDQEALQREQKHLEVRRKQRVQHEIAQQLSELDKDEYGDEILQDMLESEKNMLPDIATIDIQAEIQWYMRPYLLDFLVEAHAAFGLTSETFFLTLNILDRYCSKRTVYRRHYQLVGCTAMLVAAKFDETSKQVPHIRELANMCCHLYNEDMFVQMERHVLMTLDWHIGAPTTAAFLHSALDDGPKDSELENMSLYLAEIAIYHRDFVSTLPSELAKASLALSQIILGRETYLEPHHWASAYNSDLLILLSQHIRKRSTVLFQKYERPQTAYVSQILDKFFAHHDELARQNVVDAPPTPEASPHQVSAARTPKRLTVNVNMPPTPPITPSADTFKGYQDMALYNAPPTPTSAISYANQIRQGTYLAMG